jgi:hypothetical protein
VEAVGLLFEALILVFIFVLFWDLKTHRWTKVSVITGFLWRLP